MDGLRNPVGDETPGVYWFRRAMVLLVAVLVIAVLWWIISAALAEGEGGPEPSDEPATTTSPDATTAAAAADPSRPCTEDDLALTTAPSPDRPAVGTEPAFEVSVEHVGGSACTLSTATEGTDLTIRSGDDVYYSTSYCPDIEPFGEGRWILEPGGRETLQATWPGTRVDADCADIGEAGEGYYWVSTAVGGVSAEEVQFEMVAAS